MTRPRGQLGVRALTTAAAAAALATAAVGTASAAAPAADQADGASGHGPASPGRRIADPALAGLYQQMSGDTATVSGDGRLVGNGPLAATQLLDVPGRIGRSAGMVGGTIQHSLPEMHFPSA